jgi:hypothetical protein
LAGARYPLEAVRALRVEERVARERELADAVRELEAAGVARARAEEALAAQRTATSRVREEELARDRLGRSVAETLRAGEWLRGRRVEERTLAARLEQARARERTAETSLGAARERLAAARAEEEAIERHHRGWLDARRRSEQAREEEEADEHAGRR